MTDHQESENSSVIPGLRYLDAPAAIEWLCDAFGFEKLLVVPAEEEGIIAHAQLGYGKGMVMLGSATNHDDNPLDRYMRAPSEVGGRCTAGIYVIVEDVDAHHARALAAGAEILLPLEEQDYGGALYTCRDPEGHVWSFGSYDPWA